MTPSVSVVIPTYNRAELLRGCLTALRRCEVPDLEVVVADDGSTDHTRAVVEETWPGAVYLWAPNTGNPSAPRNRGFAASRGRYVGFLDCDDAWLPGAPARAVELLDRHPGIDLLFADARYGNPADGFRSWIADVAGRDDFRRLPRTELEPGFAALDREPFFRQMATRNAVFLGAALVRRAAFERTGGFDPTYWGGEDWEVWTRMAAGGRVGFMAEPMAIYTRHPGNVTNNQDMMVGGFCRALRNVLARCELTPASRRHVRQCLARQLFNHAYLAYDRGDRGEAGRRFRAAIRAGDRRPYTLALAASCCLPGWLASRLRRAKQGVG